MVPGLARHGRGYALTQRTQRRVCSSQGDFDEAFAQTASRGRARDDGSRRRVVRTRGKQDLHIPLREYHLRELHADGPNLELLSDLHLYLGSTPVREGGGSHWTSWVPSDARTYVTTPSQPELVMSEHKVTVQGNPYVYTVLP